MFAQGVISALVTPFEYGTEKIDEAALERVLNAQCEAGVDAVFVNGTTAEAYALEFDEKRALLSKTKSIIGDRCKVIMGGGGSTTAKVLREVEMAQEENADGMSVITPYFVTPDQNELYDYYAAIAQAATIPIIMYNHPLRTSVSIAASTAAKLHKAYPNIVGLKDSSGNMTSNMDFISACGDSFGVLSGNDGMIMPMMRMGGRGVVSATANFFPKLIVALYRAIVEQDWERAKTLQYIAFDTRRIFALGTYPVSIKEAACYAGYDMGPCRKPVHPLKEGERARLKEILDDAITRCKEADV